MPAPASPWENRSDLLRGVLAGGGTGPVPHDPDDPYARPIRGGRRPARWSAVTLPLGVTATLDADARTLTVDDPALR